MTLSIIEDPNVPMGTTVYNKTTRTVAVHPDHDGVVYFNGNIIGWHNAEQCACCTQKRPYHAAWCAHVAFATAFSAD